MKKIGHMLFLCGTVFTCSLSAEPLKLLLSNAMLKDPVLDEAKANILMAESQTKISEAGHLPVVSIAATPVIKQHHTYNGDRRSEPSLVGKVNLYSWGAVEAEIERDRHKEGFFQHKLYETREQIGQKIAQLYLTALRAKESIKIYQESVKRHQKLVKDLKVIVSYDKGRAFEMNEATSRLNQANTSLAHQERILYTTLSQLSRYSRKVLAPKDLSDPFAKINTAHFLKTFHNQNILTNPSYLAQQKEFESAIADERAAKARRLPAINLEGSASRNEREIYVNVSWDIYNPALRHNAERSAYSKSAANAKLREIELEVYEKAQTSEVEMQRNEQLMKISQKQIAIQKKVVEDYSLQFEIGMRSLLDLLNAHQELTNVQIAEVNARNDFRDAALLYLVSQSNVAKWAGIKN